MKKTMMAVSEEEREIILYEREYSKVSSRKRTWVVALVGILSGGGTFTALYFGVSGRPGGTPSLFGFAAMGVVLLVSILPHLVNITIINKKIKRVLSRENETA